jgi:hypothetical protein
MRLERIDAVIAIGAAFQARPDIAPHIEEAQPEIAHQPFVRSAGGEIDAAGLHVHRHAAGGMDHVGIDQRAMGMGEVTHRFQVMLETIDRGHL